MINVTFTAECMQFMRDCGIPLSLARETVNNRDHGRYIFGDRITAAHWFNEDELVFIETTVTKKDLKPAERIVRFVEVAVRLVLALRPSLPTGTITKNMRMDEVLAVVDESFGHLITCDPGQPASCLYSGPWDGQRFSVKTGDARGSYHIIGTFDPDKRRAELVWGFDLEKYRAWLTENKISILTPTKEAVYKTQLAELSNRAHWLVNNYSTLYPGAQQNPMSVQFSLATNILREAMGDDWCQKHMFNAANGRSQLPVVGLDGADAIKAQARAVQLGELIYNLQVVPGFHVWVRGMANRDLNAVIAEAEAAKLLATSNMRLQFAPPQGRKGSDYEMDVELPSGDIASCEVKSKRGHTQLSGRTLLKSLKKAVHQIPATRPGIILLKLPEAWIKDGPRLEGAVDYAVKRLFRDSRRVIAVVFFWQRWNELSNGTQAQLWQFREYINENSRFYTEENAHIIRDAIMQPQEKTWVHFDDVAAAQP